MTPRLGDCSPNTFGIKTPRLNHSPHQIHILGTVCEALKRDNSLLSILYSLTWGYLIILLPSICEPTNAAASKSQMSHTSVSYYYAPKTMPLRRVAKGVDGGSNEWPPSQCSSGLEHSATGSPCGFSTRMPFIVVMPRLIATDCLFAAKDSLLCPYEGRRLVDCVWSGAVLPSSSFSDSERLMNMRGGCGRCVRTSTTR